jgi:hypothetical protein
MILKEKEKWWMEKLIKGSYGNVKWIRKLNVKGTGLQEFNVHEFQVRLLYRNKDCLSNYVCGYMMI